MNDRPRREMGIMGMEMMRIAALATMILSGLMIFAGSLSETVASERRGVISAPEISDLSAQTRRIRSRIRVQRQPSAWPYPRPGAYSYPGPNAVRRCVDWYATQHRPSGAVITPQMHCWWTPG